MSVRVVDNPAKERFEIYRDDTLAGFVLYEREPDRITFIHTEIDPSFNGQGLGTELVSQVLAVVRQEGLSVVPMCPFVRQYMQRHPS